MDRSEAAALLGIDVGAGATEVRAAFRARARLAHPDAGGEAADLDALRRARDRLLLAPTEPSTPSPAPAPRRQHPHGPRSARPRTVPRAPSRMIGVVAKLVALGIAAALTAVIALVIVAAVVQSDPPLDIGPEDCLVVSGDGVRAALCSDSGAQRVVLELSGGRSCPAGTDGLISGSQTWCLEPAGS